MRALAQIQIKFALLFACSCLAVFGCAPRETPADKAAREGVLLMGNAADPATLDPTLSTGFSEYKILTALFEGLVSADTSTLEVIPAAAESWGVSDGRVWTFKIRDNAKWSDGETLKASDFVFAFRRMLDPELGAAYAHMLYPIRNAEKIHKNALPAKLLGAEALSEKVLQITLENENADFPNLLYHSAFFPLPEHVLKKLNAQKKRDAIWMRPQNAVTNGPFRLVQWRINDRVSVRKNPLYHDAENIRLAGVDFFPISNINTEDRAFRAGMLHVTESVAPIRLDAIRKNSPEVLRVADWLGVYYYLFNCAKPPLDDARVRLALSLSIERDLIIKNFLRAGQKPAESFVPTSAMRGYEPEFLQARDIAKAKKLLADAGFPNGKNFPRITISYNTSEQHRPIAEAVQASWKKNLGVDVELYNLSWPAYTAARDNGDFHIIRSSWIGDYLSPETFLSLFVSDNPINRAGWKNKEYDAKLSRAKISSPAAARKNFEEAEAILLKDAAVMPIYFYSRVYLADTRVKNLHDNALGYQNYKNIELDGGAR